MRVSLLLALLLSVSAHAEEKKITVPQYQGACFVYRGEKSGYENLTLNQGEEKNLLKEDGYEFRVAYGDRDPFWSDEGTATLTLSILKDGKPLVNTSAPLSNRIARPISLVMPEAKLRFYCRTYAPTSWVCEDDGITRDDDTPKPKK